MSARQGTAVICAIDTCVNLSPVKTRAPVLVQLLLVISAIANQVCTTYVQATAETCYLLAPAV